MKLNFAAPIAMPTALCVLSFVAYAQPSKDIQALVPQSWVVLNEGIARGDLNRDGRPDLALALGRANEQKLFESGKDSPRRLLIFFRQTDGKFKQVLANETAILGRNQGGAMGDPFQSIAVQRGALVLEHWGGSRETWEYTHRFRYENGRWRLIGFRRADRDRLTGHASQRDTNLITGEVEYSTGDLDKTTAQRRFLELRAAPAGKVGPQVRLANAATLRANIEGSILVIKAQMTNPNAVLRLRDAKGRNVKPISTQKQGNLHTVRYSWKALNPQENYWGGAGDWGENPDYIANATIEVAHGKQLWKTSRGSYPAQIRSTKWTEITLPPLK